jgi:hypothetical protein
MKFVIFIFYRIKRPFGCTQDLACNIYLNNFQAIEHIVKDKRDVAVMLSNLVNGSPPTNSSKKTKSQHANGLIQSEQDLRSTENENYELWKCNLDAFLNNPGMI